MRVYGKIIEYKSELFDAICPYNIALSSTKPIEVPWPNSTDKLETYDGGIFLYDPKNPSKIVIKATGIYRFTYIVSSSLTYGYGNAVNTAISIGNGSSNKSGAILDKTFVGSAVMDNKVTNSMSTTFKISELDSWCKLLVWCANRWTPTFIPAGFATLTIERIRTLNSGD